MSASADQLAQFADLGISASMSLEQFRTAFDAIQGRVDGAEMGRWWSAFDALATYHEAADQLAADQHHVLRLKQKHCTARLPQA